MMLFLMKLLQIDPNSKLDLEKFLNLRVATVLSQAQLYFVIKAAFMAFIVVHSYHGRLRQADL